MTPTEEPKGHRYHPNEHISEHISGVLHLFESGFWCIRTAKVNHKVNQKILSTRDTIPLDDTYSIAFLPCTVSDAAHTLKLGEETPVSGRFYDEVAVNDGYKEYTVMFYNVPRSGEASFDAYQDWTSEWFEVDRTGTYQELKRMETRSRPIDLPEEVMQIGIDTIRAHRVFKT